MKLQYSNTTGCGDSQDDMGKSISESLAEKKTKELEGCIESQEALAAESAAEGDEAGVTLARAEIELLESDIQAVEHKLEIAWTHVYSAYSISFTILLVYLLVVSVRLARFRRGEES